MTKKELKELIKETISEGFFDDMDAASADIRQLKKNNPRLVYNITTENMGNKLIISLTIDDYNQLRYPDNNGKDNKLDDIIPKHIERLIEEIADYNKRITKKL
jgi:hypothetical protein